MKDRYKSGVFAALRMAAAAHHLLTLGTILCVAASVAATPPQRSLVSLASHGVSVRAMVCVMIVALVPLHSTMMMWVLRVRAPSTTTALVTGTSLCAAMLVRQSSTPTDAKMQAAAREMTPTTQTAQGSRGFWLGAGLGLLRPRGSAGRGQSCS